MPDISMCTNNSCIVADSCYRFTATPSYRQSYCKFEPLVLSGVVACDYYIPNRIKEEKEN